MRILLIFLFSMSAMASVEHNDFNFEVNLSPGGNFEVKINMLFDSHDKFSEIITDFYLNETLKQDVDENFISQEVSFKKKSRDGASRSYSLEMKVKKSGVTATLNNNCSVTIKRKTATNSCVMTKSSTFLFGSLFKSSTNMFSCMVLENKMKKCTMTLNGQTKAIKALLMSRTSDRLALSGSAEAVAKTYFLYHERLGLNSNAITEDVYEDNIMRLWNDMMLELNNSDNLPKTITFSSSISGIQIQ